MENKLEVRVVLGDITQTPADAIITGINSAGAWFGGIDGAIQRVAGDLYHSQAENSMPLKNLGVVVAKRENVTHRGKFEDVIFVVDDLRNPVSDVVCAGLEAAHKQGYKSVSLPAIRMGVLAGKVERTPIETVQKIREGVEKFGRTYGANTSLKQITFVVYNDPETQKKIEEGFKSA